MAKDNLDHLVRWLNDLARDLERCDEVEWDRYEENRILQRAEEAKAYANRLAQRPIPGLLSRL